MEYFTPPRTFSRKKRSRALFMEYSSKKNPCHRNLAIVSPGKMPAVTIWRKESGKNWAVSYSSKPEFLKICQKFEVKRLCQNTAILILTYKKISKKGRHVGRR
jgi:hypothetical protein